MSNITYKPLATGFAVFLDKRRTGTIRRTGGSFLASMPIGWTYVPKGTKSHGEIFSSLDEVKASLEAN